MSVLSVIGTSLIDPEALMFKKIGGRVSALNIPDLQTSEGSLELNNQSIDLKALTPSDLRPQVSPIGIGKPLSVEIATVYTGNYKKFLGGRKDAVLVSGVKNAQTFQATSRAINIKAQDVNENDFLQFRAFEDGTGIVYYSPAMDTESTLLSFEMMFDNFNTELFEIVSGLLGAAAGVPVFLPAAPFLLAGSQLINIGSKLGDALFSGRPSLSGTIQVQFQSPFIPSTEPREFVIYNEKDRNELSGLKVGLVDAGGNKQLRLVFQDNSEEYRGPAPYMIVLLDGRKRPELENYAPTLATAAILKKFYGPTNQAMDASAVLQEAMQLYNDLNYKNKGDRLKQEIDKVQSGSEEFKNLESLYKAYAENIKTEQFKLPALA